MIYYESDEFWESVEERAAIMQFDAGLSAKEAQKAAFADICKFCENNV